MEPPSGSGKSVFRLKTGLCKNSRAVLDLEIELQTLTSIVHLERGRFIVATQQTCIDASGIVVNCTQVQLRHVSYRIFAFLPYNVFFLLFFGCLTLQEHLPTDFFHSYVRSCKIKESREFHGCVLSPHSGAELLSVLGRDGCCRSIALSFSLSSEKDAAD